jgi:competence protein ComEC
LLTGFLLGDTRDVSDAVVDEFRTAGLSHVLAVSGANVAFVLVLMGPLLNRGPRRSRVAIGLTVLVVFATMTRFEPSVLRAAVMAGLVMVARAVGRPADSRRVLLLAAAILLVLDPFLLHSVGFLLSCGACAGIVTVAAPITAWLRGPRWVRETLGVTLAAQIGVAPILVTVFGTVPLVALPANLIVVPLVGPLTVWGLVAGVVGGVVGTRVAFVLQLPTFAMLESVMLVARTAARSPVALDGPQLVALAAGVAGLGIIGRAARRVVTARR